MKYRFESLKNRNEVQDRITVDKISELIKCIEIYKVWLPNNGE